MKARSLAGLVAAIGLVCTTGAQAAYSNLFVFGDSLSDSGNNALVIGAAPGQVITGNTYIPTQPYASGNYTNGRTWAQRLATKTGLASLPSLAGGTNYAFGGAETSYENPATLGFPYSLTTQTNMYLAGAGGVASADALYVVAGGGNNARSALQQIADGADVGITIATAAAQYAADVGNIVNTLQAAGAQHIIVWNTPDVGLAPAILAGGAGASLLGTTLAYNMNLALAGQLFGESGVKTLNLFGLQNSWADNPGAFGFDNVTDACGALGAACNPSKYLFWDGIHPTSAGHRLVANAMHALAVPEPATYGLLLAGLFVVAGVARRRSH